MSLKRKLTIATVTLALTAGLAPWALTAQGAFAASPSSIPPTSVTSPASTAVKVRHRHLLEHLKFVVIAHTAKILSIKIKAILPLLHQGQSLSQIATAHGVSQTDLVSQLEATITAPMQKAVQSGKIKLTHAIKLKDRLDKKITTLVTKTNWKIPVKIQRGFVATGRHALTAEIAKLLHITPNQLAADRKSGQSITQIAATKQVPLTTLEQDLKAYVMAKLDQRLPKLLQQTPSSKTSTTATTNSSNS